nr:AAC(3) family N-acetyltransferase [uncultured Flavonifractor sp.]
MTGVHWEIAEADWPKIRAIWPAYDKDITPTNTMGAVAEMFRRWPGTVRSDHPVRSFAVNGKMHSIWWKIMTCATFLGKVRLSENFMLWVGKYC